MIQSDSGIPADYHGPIGGQGVGNGPPEYEPSDEERQAIKLVEKVFAKNKAARKAYDGKWLDNYKMFRGKQWKENRPSYRHSEVINLIFKAIQADVPILTDGMPRPQYIPPEPQDLELAEILNNVLESDWNSGNWLSELTESIYDAHFYGVGFGSLDYDPEAAGGMGKIVFKSEDTFCSFPDPSARDVNKRSNSFVFAEPTAVDILKHDYPEKAKYIKPDLLDLSRRDRANWDDQKTVRSPDNTRVVSDNLTGYDLESKDEALKITLYIHDSEYCEDEIKEKDSTTGEEKIAYQQRLKYPNGRKIVIANGVLCEDGPIPFDDKKFPYLRLVNYILPREFWGISEVEQLESPQKIFNKLVSFALDVLTLMGNPIWKVPTSSGVDTDSLYNRPGLILEYDGEKAPEREEGVQLQPYVLQMIDRMKGWFDDMSGQTDVSAGKNPAGVTAASAIEALQEASQTRLRQKTRDIDAFLQDFGRMYASRVFQFYDTPRVFRVTGDDNVSKYFKFHVEKVPVMETRSDVDPITGAVTETQVPTGETKSVAKVRDYVVGTDGKYYPGEERVFESRGEFDVRVSTGSSLPFEKNRIEQQSFALFDRQIIDAEEVLKNIKYPNADAVLSRMAEKAAMAAQQAAMGQTPAPAA